MKNLIEHSGCVILLQHSYAQEFFKEAMHPNIEELKRRDAFLSRLQKECSIHTDGMNLTIEIPDIDIVKIMEGESKVTL